MLLVAERSLSFVSAGEMLRLLGLRLRLCGNRSDEHCERGHHGGTAKCEARLLAPVLKEDARGSPSLALIEVTAPVTAMG